MQRILYALSFVVALNAFAHESEAQLSGRRLIEIRPGVQKWSTAAERSALSLAAHQNGKCGGFMDITKYADSSPADFRSFTIDYATLEPKEFATVQPMLQRVDAADLIARITKLSAYQNRYYESTYGVDAANYIVQEFRAIAASRPDITVATEKHDFAQPSVIVTIPGTGPQQNEIVVIGGHIDSINQGAIFSKKKARAPGADDNASGTATVMQTLKILVDSGFRPNRTIQLMGYAGEEIGLLGSQDIAQRYKKEAKTVAGALQFDMTMYPGDRPHINLISDYTDASLTTFIEKLAKAYVPAVAVSRSPCGYACSDHASWNKAGYPSAFPFEADMGQENPDIHTTADTVDKLDSTHGTHFAKLAVAFAVEMAQAN